MFEIYFIFILCFNFSLIYCEGPTSDQCIERSTLEEQCYFCIADTSVNQPYDSELNIPNGLKNIIILF